MPYGLRCCRMSSSCDLSWYQKVYDFHFDILCWNSLVNREQNNKNSHLDSWFTIHGRAGLSIVQLRTPLFLCSPQSPFDGILKTWFPSFITGTGQRGHKSRTNGSKGPLEKLKFIKKTTQKHTKNPYKMKFYVATFDLWSFWRFSVDLSFFTFFGWAIWLGYVWGLFYFFCGRFDQCVCGPFDYNPL